MKKSKTPTLLIDTYEKKKNSKAPSGGKTPSSSDNLKRKADLFIMFLLMAVQNFRMSFQS